MKVIYFLSGFGIILASYLLYSFLFHPAFQPCSINTVINCDAVIKGEVSTLFGLPTALYGLAGYVMIFFAALFKQKKLLFGVATFGLLFCLRITIIELFFIKVYCPICLLCQLDMATLFFVSIYLLRKKS